MRLFYHFALVTLLLQLASSFCCAQYYFKHYQTDNGLAHNAVRSILQDSKGIIWIGTRGGLNRFDGYTFKLCGNKANKFGHIGNNVINAIAEDKNGILWLATGNGIYRYDPNKEVVYPLESAPQQYISHLLIDGENNVWFSANSALYKYNQEKNKIEDHHMEASCISIDKSQNLWIGGIDGTVSIYNIRSKLVTKTQIIDKSVPLNLRLISTILPLSDGEALIGCFKRGLKSYNAKTGVIKKLPLNKEVNTDMYVRDIIAGNNNDYWIATESGAYIYDLATNTSVNLRKRADDPYSISDNAVYIIYKDNQGGIWAGTFFGGLNYCSRENARFKKYYPLLGANSISGSAVREISSDEKGDLWIGTEDAGINKFELKTGKFTNFLAAGGKNDISYHNVHGLLAFDKQLFIGPFHRGMEIMNANTGLITKRFQSIGGKDDITNDFVISIYLTKDSTILVGTAYNVKSGLFKYNIKEKQFKRLNHLPDNCSVFSISEDQHGNIWTGTVAQGAYYYNPKTGQHGNIRFSDKINGESVNEFPVYGILEDSNHAIWFTTEGGGLIKLGPDKKVLKKFSIEDGLPTNVVFRILEDDSKRLWISSLKGLICFDMETEKFKTHTQANGLSTDQFNFNSAYKDKEGKMYFGSVKGMIAFDPKEFAHTDISPPTYITGFQINNKEVIPDTNGSPLRKSILYTDSLALFYNQNNFSIEFAALNYSSPEVTRYEYLMQGLDKDWTYLSSNRKAYFTDLSPGKYTFIVRAKSNVGSWTGTERRLFIEIIPPIWKSPAGYFLYLFTFSFALLWSILYYHRYLESKNLNKLQLFEHEKEKEISQAKIEFFTNIAHEIQTPLTLIIGPVERILKKTEAHGGIKKSLLMIEKNANRLAELTSQLLDFRKTEMHQFGLNFVNTNINILLKEQIAGFKQAAAKEQISLNIELPKDHLIAFVDMEALVKIFSNMISNAIKYSSSTATVSLIGLDATNERFIIRFSNDGKGIPDEYVEQIFEPFFRLHSKNKPGTGIGLSLAKSLTELHNGTLKLISGSANMVIFELTLPIRQKFEFKLSSWKKIE